MENKTEIEVNGTEAEAEVKVRKTRKLYAGKLRAVEGSISAKLRGLRIKNGLSQRQVAVASNLSSPAISMIESGGGDNMNVKSLKKLADAYGVKISELLAQIGE